MAYPLILITIVIVALLIAIKLVVKDSLIKEELKHAELDIEEMLQETINKNQKKERKLHGFKTNENSQES